MDLTAENWIELIDLLDYSKSASSLTAHMGKFVQIR